MQEVTPAWVGSEWMTSALATLLYGGLTGGLYVEPSARQTFGAGMFVRSCLDCVRLGSPHDTTIRPPRHTGINVAGSIPAATCSFLG